MREAASNRSLLKALLACFLLAPAAVSIAAAQGAAPADAQVQADAQKQLHGKQFRGVQVQVANGVATLTGEVDRLADKLDAKKRVERMHETASVNDQLQVNVPSGISDEEIFRKLGKALAYNRVGYPSFPFNSITLHVQNGVAILGGEVVAPIDKESAIEQVVNTPGVRGLDDHLQVAPLSDQDWQIRRAVYQAVYGASQLNKYAIDPAKPIRIVVINGHVTLTGLVDNRGDREVANIRANTVPGVFSVTNDLQVAGEAPER